MKNGLWYLVIAVVIVAAAWFFFGRSGTVAVLVDDFPFTEEMAASGETVIDGKTLCGSGCRAPAKRDGDVWCQQQTACTDRDCECNLFSREKDAPRQDPDSWRFERGPGNKMPEDEDRAYHCFCTR